MQKVMVRTAVLSAGFVRKYLRYLWLFFFVARILFVSYTVRKQSVLGIFTMSVCPASSLLLFSLACLFCSRSSRAVRNGSAAAASSLACLSSRTFLLIRTDSASRWDSVLLSAWVWGNGLLAARRWRPRCCDCSRVWAWLIDGWWTGWWWCCGCAEGGWAAPPAGCRSDAGCAPNWCWWWSGWPDGGRPP